MGPKTSAALIAGVLLAGSAGAFLTPSARAETRSFAALPGDTVVVQNDFGRIRVRAAAGTQVVAQIEKILSPQPTKDPLVVISQKSGDKIFFYSFFSGQVGESVDIDIQAPRQLNVVIWGANPAIEISGMQGIVRAQNFTGSIRVTDLTSSVSLISDRGDIQYRAGVQPRGDARLETTSGNIQCDLAGSLNLRGWLRAGGTLAWDTEPELQGTSLEKQLGTFGPLLYAGSMNGNIRVRLMESGGTSPAAEPAAPAEKSADMGRRRELPAEIPPALHPPTSASADPPPAREPRPEPPPAQPTGAGGSFSLKVNVDSVYMNLSVRDRASGQSITGLGKEDFLVYEDGVPQDVDQLLPAETPFNLLLLLDISGSTRSFLGLMKQASIEFTREINARDRLAVATFNSNARLVEDFTGDRGEVARAIGRIRSGGGTAFYDGLMTCADDYMGGIEGRKAIVVFTDGVDSYLLGDFANGSKTRFADLYRRIQELDTIIYTIFLDTEGSPPMTRSTTSGDDLAGQILGGILRGRGAPRTAPRRQPPPSRNSGHRAAYVQAREQLLTIAEQTGGRMYSPARIEDLAQVYAEIADDLRVQYMLGYNSTNPAHDGRWRSIRVKVRDHPEAVVRTRKGYYARQG